MKDYPARSFVWLSRSIKWIILDFLLSTNGHFIIGMQQNLATAMHLIASCGGGDGDW